jgi:hypothetical protein
METETFAEMLSGGHHNSLGRTVEVVEIILENPDKLQELYDCYFSTDELVRLRTSNAIKRISREKPEWLVPYIDRFIDEVSGIDQASAQWTLANLFQTLSDYMTPKQKRDSLSFLKRNLETHHDWIVLNLTMETLTEWAETDKELKAWLIPHLERLQSDQRKSVAGRAKKLYHRLEP